MSLTKLRDSLILSYIGWFSHSPRLRSAMAKITPAPIREGYSSEWLKLEAELGTRPSTSGLPGVDVPFLNKLCVDLASQWPPIGGLKIDNEDIPKEDGAAMKCRIYRPQHASSALPIMVYFHGGGYRSGNLDTEDAQCRMMAKGVPCTVVSVDYPHTHKPDGSTTGTTIDTIIAGGVTAVKWARTNAPRLGADESKLVVAGGSAGAALTAQVVYHFVSSEESKVVAGAVLFNPITVPIDYCQREAKYSHLHTSYVENKTGVPLINTPDIEDMHVSTQTDSNSPKHFPALGDLSNFPPSYIITAEKDPVRDDGTVLHAILQDCGIRTKLAFYPGLPHYFHIFPAVPTAHTCMQEAIEGVRFVLGDDVRKSKL